MLLFAAWNLALLDAHIQPKVIWKKKIVAVFDVILIA